MLQQSPGAFGLGLSDHCPQWQPIHLMMENLGKVELKVKGGEDMGVTRETTCIRHRFFTDWPRSCAFSCTCITTMHLCAECMHEVCTLWHKSGMQLPCLTVLCSYTCINSASTVPTLEVAWPTGLCRVWFCDHVLLCCPCDLTFLDGSPSPLQCWCGTVWSHSPGYAVVLRGMSQQLP